MEILLRGFELLETRRLNEKIEISAIERKYGVIMPPMYRLFAETFYLTLKKKEEGEIEFLPVENLFGDKILFDSLFPIEFCAETYVEYEFWRSKGLMMIGGGPSEGGILLSIEGEDIDSIVYNDANKYVKIAKNIFEFFRDVVLVAN